MSTYISGAQIRALLLGVRVDKAASDVTDKDLFSVDGGRVFITSFVGEVTTVIGGGSQDIGLHFDPDDGGSNVVLADEATPLVIDADATGTFYTLNATAAGDAVEELDVAYGAKLAKPILLGLGDIVLDGTGTETGAIKWTLTYIPLDDGAVVTAS